MVESPFDVEIRVGEVLEAEPFPEANKPKMTKLWITLGEDHGEIQSAAQLDHHYEPSELEGRRVLCATNLGSVRIAGFKSEALTVGVPDEDEFPVLVEPDRDVDVPLGGSLY
ncbi:tRNA-binding domain-containing protein [Natrialba asiatica]|uniref:tRNA-binding domain-containing protein n=1 Tax=Natrialba asiatica (strain ATCC 700177 / DSM 12278 / JCM 9576 / FERM P-10747 / NBRC 102637 / 172P1) TaxID=29540 RepID=M0AZ13_NATA1|nr:tRNA-binding domain-containing protein [Natrialba asiatica]ELZ03911.1 tRNA-binding domain-containing protein [Natrialba asiatica DSM 12278]